MSLEGHAFEKGKEPKKIPSRNEGFEASRLSAKNILEELESLPNAKEFANVTTMYHELSSGPLVVRREDPDRLMEAVLKEAPLSIQFDGNLPYANSVVWDPDRDGPRGLDNAILEGYGHRDYVVLVYGFEKPEDFFLEKHEQSQQSFAGMDRSRVRAAAGFVPPENIRFITMRVPIKGFPEERMTEEEKDSLWEYENEEGSKPRFIYRGFLMRKDEAAHRKMAA